MLRHRSDQRRKGHENLKNMVVNEKVQFNRNIASQEMSSKGRKSRQIFETKSKRCRDLTEVKVCFQQELWKDRTKKQKKGNCQRKNATEFLQTERHTSTDK